MRAQRLQGWRAHLQDGGVCVSGHEEANSRACARVIKFCGAVVSISVVVVESHGQWRPCVVLQSSSCDREGAGNTAILQR